MSAPRPIGMVWLDDEDTRPVVAALTRMLERMTGDPEDRPYACAHRSVSEPHEVHQASYDVMGDDRLTVWLPIPEDRLDGHDLHAHGAETIRLVLDAIATLPASAPRRLGENQNDWLIAAAVMATPHGEPWSIMLPTPWSPLVVIAEGDGNVPVPRELIDGFTAAAPSGVCLITQDAGPPGSPIVSVNVNVIGAWTGTDANSVHVAGDPMITMRAIARAVEMGAMVGDPIAAMRAVARAVHVGALPSDPSSHDQQEGRSS